MEKFEKGEIIVSLTKVHDTSRIEGSILEVSQQEDIIKLEYKLQNLNKMKYNSQLENYYSRIKEVLEVTGKLTVNDLYYCKLLTEKEAKNYFVRSGFSVNNFLNKCFCEKGKRSTAVSNCDGNCKW